MGKKFIAVVGMFGAAGAVHWAVRHPKNRKWKTDESGSADTRGEATRQAEAAKDRIIKDREARGKESEDMGTIGGSQESEFSIVPDFLSDNIPIFSVPILGDLILVVLCLGITWGVVKSFSSGFVPA